MKPKAMREAGKSIGPTNSGDGKSWMQVFVSWNRVSLTPKHYTQWKYVCVRVCMSSLIKELNFNVSMGYSRHSWYTSRMKVHVEFACVYHTDKMLLMRHKPPLSITKAHVSFSDTPLVGMKSKLQLVTIKR